MQRKDIKVGEHYAYRYHKYSHPIEVEVVSLDNGIKVREVETNELMKGSINGRHLTSTWADELAAQAAAKARREENEARRRAQAARRAEIARRVEERLAAHGREPHWSGVYDRHNRTVLETVGFELGDGAQVLSRLADLADFMRHGTLDERDVAVLLGVSDLGWRKPETEPDWRSAEATLQRIDPRILNAGE